MPIGGEERLGRSELLVERIFLGLRGGGLGLDRLVAEFDYDVLGAHRETVERLRHEGRLEIRDGMLCLTRRGYLLCDEIAARLAPR